MDNPGQRLKEVRVQNKLSQQELAEMLGFKWHKIKDIETGKQKLTPDIAEKIEKLFSIDGWWLLTGAKSKPVPNNSDIVVNYYLEVYASAGYGSTNNVELPQKITLSQFFIEALRITNPSAIDIIRIYGDSMEPDFHDGQLIVVERIRDIEEVPNGATVIANIKGDLYVKKLSKIPFKPQIILTSSNKAYDPITIEVDQLKDLIVVGIVKGSIKLH